MKNILNKINELKKKINEWDKAYYKEDSPVVSDLVWDAAMKELIQLEKDYPEFLTEDSPSQKIGGGQIDNRFKKVNHVEKMMSISNALNFEELKAFDQRVRKNLSSNQRFSYFCELKIDGLSIAIRYRNGKLVQAITRGNGQVGEDVTHNVLEISDIPKTIKYKNDLEVRGEIYMSNDVFNELNEKGLGFANPRNAAAGSLRQLKSSVVKERKLSSFMYFVYDPKSHHLNTQLETIEFLKLNGFKTNDMSFILEDINDAKVKIEEITEKRPNLPYEIDGVVVKVNEIDLYQEIGYTIKFPKYMIAYKFPEEIGETKLIDIFATVGKTGKITYNAKLEPIRLAGTLVGKSTLHNADYIRELDINIGDIVRVKKAGEIIPKVIGVSIKNNNEKWNETKECPTCNSKLVRREERVDQYCINSACPSVILSKLTYFVSRNCMNIDGLSEKILKKLFELEYIKDFADIYKLEQHKSDLIGLDKMGDKSISNLLRSIERSKSASLSQFINALNIEYVGEKISGVIAKRFKSIDKIKEASFEELSAIPEIGDSIAKSIKQWFLNEINYNLIDKFRSLGINPVFESNEISQKLSGLTFVLTGKLNKPRKEYSTLIESHGGNVSSSVSANTSYVLVGEDAGSKLEKATKLGVNVIDEDGLNKLLEEK